MSPRKGGGVELPLCVLVICPWLGEQGENDPATLARLHGSSYFCSACGATDHDGLMLSDADAITAAARAGRRDTDMPDAIARHLPRGLGR